METIRLKNSDLKKLKRYKLAEGIYNTESKIYLYHSNQLLKIIKNTEKDNMINKMYILSKLFYLKEQTKQDRLVLPNASVRVNDEAVGYTMDFIKDNINLELLLKDSNVPIKNKIEMFKQISKIIEIVEYSDAFKKIGFHLGDIHDSNFIYDNTDGKVKAIDLDSSYVPSMTAPNSRFLTFNDKLWDEQFVNKYPMDENDRHIPNYNTTIMCYIYMLLNNITGEYVPDLSIASFCEELNMLVDSGFEKELTDTFFNIYKPKDNYFDFELMDTVTPQKILKYKEIKTKKYK